MIKQTVLNQLRSKAEKTEVDLGLGGQESFVANNCMIVTKEIMLKLLDTININMKGMSKVDGYVWCDVHGCIHEETTNPYEVPYEYRNGRPVFMEENDDGEIVEAEPECSDENWHTLYCDVGDE